MDASDAQLLDERSSDAPTLLPALQKLLQLAHAGDTDDQVQVREAVLLWFLSLYDQKSLRPC